MARESGSAELVAEAEQLLAELPEVSTLPGARRPRDDSFAPDAEELREALERARETEARSEREALERKP